MFLLTSISFLILLNAGFTLSTACDMTVRAYIEDGKTFPVSLLYYKSKLQIICTCGYDNIVPFDNVLIRSPNNWMIYPKHEEGTMDWTAELTVDEDLILGTYTCVFNATISIASSIAYRLCSPKENQVAQKNDSRLLCVVIDKNLSKSHWLDKILCDSTHIDIHDSTNLSRVSNSKTICNIGTMRYRTLCEALSVNGSQPVLESEDTYDSACEHSSANDISFTVFQHSETTGEYNTKPMQLGEEIHIKRLPFVFKFVMICHLYHQWIRMDIMPPLSATLVPGVVYYNRIRCNFTNKLTYVNATITADESQLNSFKKWFEIETNTKHITRGRVYGFLIYTRPQVNLSFSTPNCNTGTVDVNVYCTLLDDDPKMKESEFIHHLEWLKEDGTVLDTKEDSSSINLHVNESGNYTCRSNVTYYVLYHASIMHHVYEKWFQIDKDCSIKIMNDTDSTEEEESTKSSSSSKKKSVQVTSRQTSPTTVPNETSVFFYLIIICGVAIVLIVIAGVKFFFIRRYLQQKKIRYLTGGAADEHISVTSNRTSKPIEKAKISKNCSPTIKIRSSSM